MFQPNLENKWLKRLCSKDCNDLFLELFWLIHSIVMIQRIEKPESFFIRVSHLYTRLFKTAKGSDKDDFFHHLPDMLGHSIFNAFIASFPKQNGRFDDAFKCVISDVVLETLTGTFI